VTANFILKSIFSRVKSLNHLIFAAKAAKMNAKTIGQIIHAHRKASGLSREACARLAGVGKTVIYDMEHGKETMQLDTLLKVLRVLNISILLNSPIMKQLGYAES
jgi:HTH-type transcriptional regulator/antitoxin HipB